MSHMQQRLKSTAAVDVVKDSTKTCICKNVRVCVFVCVCVCSTVGKQLQIAG